MSGAKADFQDDLTLLDGQLLQADIHAPALTGACQQIVPPAEPVVGCTPLRIGDAHALAANIAQGLYETWSLFADTPTLIRNEL